MSADNIHACAGEKSCDRCGNFDALEMAGQFLCADCIALAGCGCAGHGPDPGE